MFVQLSYVQVRKLFLNIIEQLQLWLESLEWLSCYL
jgi:hypothetical protein